MFKVKKLAGTKKDKDTCTKQRTNITKFEIIISNPAILIPGVVMLQNVEQNLSRSLQE